MTVKLKTTLYDQFKQDNTRKVQITDNFDYTEYFDEELNKINKSLMNLENNILGRNKEPTKINFIIKNKREKYQDLIRERFPITRKN